MEKLAHEGLVDNSHPRRTLAICFGKGAARQDRNLECREVIRRDVYLSRHNFLSRFFTVADGYPSGIQRTLIGQA